MRTKLLLFLLGVLCSYTNVLSQTTYFIKYASSVSVSEIDGKVLAKQVIPSGLNSLVNFNVNSVDYLAKDLGKQSEVLSRIIKITVDESIPETSVLNLKNIDPTIEYIEKSHEYKMDIVPNDSLVNEQWALEKIQAFDAWNKTEGDVSVLLAIIDTGIDYLHPDLQNKIYLNPGETGTDANGDDKRSNGIDDDGNGFVDDYRGWDFTDRVGFPFDSSGGDYLDWDNDPMDEQGHGTYIAGIAGAETNNIIGIAGVAPNIKLLNLRAFDPSGYGEEDDVAAAILYAVQMGARVINMSFGDDAFSLVLRDVISFAYSQGVVLVGSSGNSGSTAPHYPSGYSEVISVGNSTSEDYVASNSNYGSTLDLVAPGSSIITTARNNNYAVISGTSAATPHVAGAAALILSIQNFTNEEVKQIIKSTTDDIYKPGWDLRSGAGRLNLYRAVTVIAPSVIKINHPTQDFATLDNEITVNASVLSPLFVSYSLFYGTGYNPTNWTALIENGTNQFSNEDIYTLDISSLPDSVYAFRLVVQLSNGRTLEERVNFLISRTPPVTELISVGPAFYGDKTTILAAMYTDEPSLVRMYYRKIGDVNFNFVTLDGFTTNNQFIKQLHYGFIPRQIVQQNSAYEIYFEAENLVGLTTTVNDNGANFIFSTSYEAEYFGETELEYSLPAGSIFENPVSLATDNNREIYLREFTNPKVSELFKLNSLSFELTDSIENRIVRDFGDFNNNGLKDVLAYFIRNGFIYEQSTSNSTSVVQKFAQETGDFWPVMAKDIDNDGTTEIVAVDSDTSFTVWNVNSDLSLSNPVELINFTDKSFGGNIIDAPNGVLSDINGDGRKELWFVDLDGDIFSYEIFGPDDYRQGSVVQTGFTGSAAFIANGDYNGDGIDELAVLLHSIEQVDVAPFYRLIVFNLIGNNFNIIYDRAFIDAATEFNSTFQRSENSLRFVDIDNDLQDELVVFMFPYAYIFKNDFGINKIVAYKENINSNSIFVGDLNLNGVPEIAFPTAESIKFYEFAGSNKANTPYNINGYSIDSSTVQLSWAGNVDQYFIYRGLNIDNLKVIDSVFSDQYIDVNLNSNTNYYYAVQAYDPFKLMPFSNLSSIAEVYVHTPGKVLTALPTSPKTVTVTFSEKMNNTIENLQAFELTNVGFPNSIAPATQYSYLLTFRNPIPVGENQLLIKDLRDLFGSQIQNDIISFNMDSTIAIQEFFISSFKIENPYLIKIVFNFDVDETTASDVNNYLFEPGNKATSVSIDENNKRIVYLNLKGQKPVGSIGREYVLRISNIRSSVATGHIEINSGAGSYIVLTGFAKDLSDVYVYPNPVKIGMGNDKITFANLPQFAKITIWTIDGVKVGELEEQDGNGGVNYNLKDFSGDYLGSGIYIYRVVMLDQLKNESDEKTGKFAVIR
ncbi:thermophilic serine proteinase precursor [bacterium BMS3Abin03]|nr:thermophilic serine proteinase precursor [bacterium BMS3Abin03]